MAKISLIPIPPPPSMGGEKYIQVGPKVMRGGELIAGARSNNTARLIVNALNAYTPNKRGQ